MNLASDLAAALDPASIFRRVVGAPDPWQVSVLGEAERDVLINSSRQAGKSTTVACRAAHRAVFFPASLVVCVSPSQRQSGELFLKILEALQSVPDLATIVDESAVRIRLANGSRVVSLPGSEATIRGYSAPDLVLVDEAARVPDDVFDAVSPMLATSDGRLIALSTPWSKAGCFFEWWTDASLDFLRISVPATSCPRISAAFLASERRRLDPWTFAREYDCTFASTTESAFADDLIDAAIRTDVQPLFGATP